MSDLIVLEAADAPQKLMGWRGTGEERRAFEAAVEAGAAAEYGDVAEKCDAIIAGRLAAIGEGARRPFTWELEAELVREGVMEKPFPVHTQDTGNCVAAAIEMLGQQRQIIEVAIFRQEERPRPWFTPWVYAISRNQIGGGMSGAGSTGAWGARAVAEYGVLFADDEGVPPYHGTSDRWGSRRNVTRPEYAEFFDVAADNKAQIVKFTDVEKMLDAVEAGIPLSIASNWGFSVREYKGFHCFRPSGSWSHQMHFTDVRRDPFVALYRGNQWGPKAHGTPRNGERPGGAWNLADDIARELRTASVYGFFDFEGEPAPIDPGIL